MKFINDNIPRDIIQCCQWRPDDSRPWYRDGNIVYSKLTSLKEAFDSEYTNDPYNLVTEEGDFTVYHYDKDFYSIRYTNGYPHGYSYPIPYNVNKWFGTNLNIYPSRYDTELELLPFGTLKRHNDLIKTQPLIDPSQKELLYINFSPNSSYQRVMICHNLDYFKKFANIEFPPQNSSQETYDQHMKSYIHMTSIHKFILCPEGCGVDTFRIWEALSLGCIPILERSYFSRYFWDLPVLVVNSYLEITPELLNKEYKRIMNGDYNLAKLTKDYWLRKINSL